MYQLYVLLIQYVKLPFAICEIILFLIILFYFVLICIKCYLYVQFVLIKSVNILKHCLYCEGHSVIGVCLLKRQPK